MGNIARSWLRSPLCPRVHSCFSFQGGQLLPNDPQELLSAGARPRITGKFLPPWDLDLSVPLEVSRQRGQQVPSFRHKSPSHYLSGCATPLHFTWPFSGQMCPSLALPVPTVTIHNSAVVSLPHIVWPARLSRVQRRCFFYAPPSPVTPHLLAVIVCLLFLLLNCALLEAGDPVCFIFV